jgi:hypothetical protein
VKAQNNPSQNLSPVEDHRVLRSRIGTQVLVWLLIALALAGATIWTGWQLLGQPTIKSEPDSLEPSVLIELVKVALALVAGLGGVLALVVAYRRQRLGEAEHNRQEAAARREDQKQYSDRFAKATEQLGSERSAIRLAGVYALGSLSDDWPAGRQTCIDVLCAYLRMPYRQREAPPMNNVPPPRSGLPQIYKWQAAISTSAVHDPNEEYQVRSAIVRVIVDHLNPQADHPWFGHEFDLSGGVFEELYLEGATFKDCHLNLRDSFLYGEVWLSEITFTGGRLDMFGATLAGRCSFELAKFSETEVDLPSQLCGDAHLTFYGASLSRTKVRGTGTTLRSKAGISIIAVEMSESSIELGTIDAEDSSLAFSRCELVDSRIETRALTLRSSQLYLSGIRIGEHSRVAFEPHPHPFPSERDAFADSELALNDVGIDGGELTFKRISFRHTPVIWELLDLSTGALNMEDCQFTNSPIAFVLSARERGSLTISGERDSTSDVDLTGLRQPSIAGASVHLTPKDPPAMDD